MWKPLGTRKSYFFRNFLIYEAMRRKFFDAISIMHPNLLTYREQMSFTHHDDKENNNEFGEFLLNKCRTDKQFINYIIDSGILSAKKIMRVSKWLYSQDLSMYNNKQLAKFLMDISETYMDLFPYFSTTVFVDRIEKEVLTFLENNIEKTGIGTNVSDTNEFKNKQNKQNVQNQFMKLITSDKFSIIMLEQIEFLEMAAKIEEMIKTHHERFFWLPTTDESPSWTVNYFKEKVGLKETDYKDYKKKIDTISETHKKNQEEKNEIIKRLNPPAYIRQCVRMLEEFTWLRLYSRNIFNFALAHSEPLFEEIAKRANICRNICSDANTDESTDNGCSCDVITVEDIKFCTPYELRDILIYGKELDKELIEQRKEAILFIYKNGNFSFHIGKEAKRMYNLEVEKETLTVKKPYKQSTKSLLEIKGVVVSSGSQNRNSGNDVSIENDESIEDEKNIKENGNITGTVKIVLTTEDGKNLNKNDILVARNTNPNLIDAIMKAKAIITDEGGITCHAAIVSRELGKPCIVGTKIATKVLKDGDVVELDIINGSVRCVKR